MRHSLRERTFNANTSLALFAAEEDKLAKRGESLQISLSAERLASFSCVRARRCSPKRSKDHGKQSFKIRRRCLRPSSDRPGYVRYLEVCGAEKQPPEQSPQLVLVFPRAASLRDEATYYHPQDRLTLLR